MNWVCGKSNATPLVTFATPVMREGSYGGWKVVDCCFDGSMEVCINALMIMMTLKISGYSKVLQRKQFPISRDLK